MKKLKLNIRKGFTLVECIVAIAVFAVMTSMVLLIMSSTVQTSKKASESEKGLNQLVQNVVQDNSNKVYGADSKTLEMAFSGAYSADFAITYTTVDGARNLFRCPSCGEEGNSMNFMDYLYSQDAYKNDPDKGKYRISHYFKPSTDYYECPMCQTKTYASSVKFICTTCEEGGAMSATSFNYDDINGGYVCKNCGSGKVVQVDATTNLPINDNSINSNYDFQISSIQPNAIRYAKIDEPKAEDRKKFFSISSDKNKAKGYTVNLSYTASSDKYAAGVYTLTLSSIQELQTDETASISITLPGGYAATLLPSSTGVNTPNTTASSRNDSYAEATWSPPDGNDYINTNKTSTLTISGLKTGNSSGITLKFTLTNHKNNQSFNVDYEKEGGLMKYWFGSSGSAITYTKPDES